MSPTSTARLPPVIACACGVCIWRMSHCSGESVSVSLAGAFGRSPPPLLSLAAGSLPRDARPAVEATPSTLGVLDHRARERAAVRSGRSTSARMRSIIRRVVSPVRLTEGQPPLEHPLEPVDLIHLFPDAPKTEGVDERE